MYHSHLKILELSSKILHEKYLKGYERSRILIYLTLLTDNLTWISKSFSEKMEISDKPK